MYPLAPEQLYELHDYMSIVMLIVCVLICYAGYTLTSQTYKKYISYKPKIKVEEGIRRFIEWYKSYYKIRK